MNNRENNYAFIDSNNLYQSLAKDLFKDGKKIFSGWKLNHEKFRIYLKDKYSVSKAFLFIGFKFGNQNLYTKLQEYGFICVFKPTLELKDESVKGNVDAELVLHSMIEYNNYEKAVIVSGDGDFYCIAEHLKSNGKLKKILAPNQFNYSCLFNILSTPDNNVLDFLDKQQNKLAYIRKSSLRD